MNKIGTTNDVIVAASDKTYFYNEVSSTEWQTLRLSSNNYTGGVEDFNHSEVIIGEYNASDKYPLPVCDGNSSSILAGSIANGLVIMDRNDEFTHSGGEKSYGLRIISAS